MAETKDLNKFGRWKKAIKEMSPYRMASNQYYGQLGNVFFMFCGICFLFYLSVIRGNINLVWFLFFMPFVLFLQILNLIAFWQRLNEFKKIQHIIDKQKEVVEDEDKNRDE